MLCVVCRAESVGLYYSEHNKEDSLVDLCRDCALFWVRRRRKISSFTRSDFNEWKMLVHKARVLKVLYPKRVRS